MTVDGSCNRASWDDFYPFGMQMEPRCGNQGQGDTRYKFTEKERDVESQYDCFGARYYDARVGRWLAADPLMETTDLCSWSAYHYSFDSPLRFTDPSGMVPGEYRDEKGKKIGDDNRPDNKVYVTDRKTIALYTNDGNTDWAAVQGDKGTVLLPSAETRVAIGVSIQRATPNNEVGGLMATTIDGKEKVINAKPGEAADPSKENQATVDIWALQNPSDIGDVKSVSGPFHTHPSATVRIGNNVHSFSQPPSEADISNMATYHYTGNGYVFGMRSGTVYIYNQEGVIRTYPISSFVKQ